MSKCLEQTINIVYNKILMTLNANGGDGGYSEDDDFFLSVFINSVVCVFVHMFIYFLIYLSI